MVRMRTDRDLHGKLYLQLYQNIEQDIINGKLKHGDRLPSYRRSTQRFGISISTVKQAYAKLAEMGIVDIIQGSGCYVRSVSSKEYFTEQIVIENFEQGQVLDSPVVNFSSASPFTPTYPVKEFGGILAELVDGGPDPAFFAYGHTQGSVFLRTVLAGYLREWGITASPEDIHVTGGGQQGIDMACKAFRGEPFSVAVENPGYTVAVNSFLNQRGEIFPIPMREDGADLDVLRRLLTRRRISLFYLMASYQSPTNVCWSDEKKRELLALAGQYDFRILEDDCWAELTYEGEPPLPLKSLDTEDRVIYIKSFSKILMPGLRAAFVLTPPDMTRRFVTAKFFSDIASPELLQHCLGLFIERGCLAAHVQWLRGHYRERHIIMKRLIGESGCLRIAHETNGGLCFWVEMLRPVDSYGFYQDMRHKNIRFLPGNLFSRDGSHGSFLRLSYAVPTETEMRHGLELIRAALQPY